MNNSTQVGIKTGPQALKSSIQLNELSSTLFVVVLNPKLFHFRCAAICLDVLSFVEMCCHLFICAVVCLYVLSFV